jgi:hypothetical protein
VLKTFDMVTARDASSSRSPYQSRDSLQSTWLVRGDPTSYYYTLIDIIRNKCDLLSLARLGCSSKLGRSLVTAVVHNNLQDTICRALENAPACESRSKDVCVLQWLLDVASQHGQQQQHLKQQQDALAGKLDAGSLLLVQQVPAAAATTLIAAGLLIIKQQVLEAARAQVTGLEVWLQALDKPNVLLSGWAHTICCHGNEVNTARAELHAIFQQ